MKLHGKQPAQGFYETFSDVIFATMAIFVLLMIIFAMAAEITSERYQARQELEKIENELAQLEQEKQRISAQADEQESKLAELRDQSIEIFIAVDKSNSMEQELRNLANAIQNLARILPQVIDNVELGVIAYRWRYEGGDDTEIFPLQKIVSANEDGGKSINELSQFLRRQTHAGGPAPIYEASEYALQQLKVQPRVNQVFMVLGDVGPYEVRDQSHRVTPAGQAKANSLVTMIKNWVDQAPNRNLILLFSGRDEMNDYRADANWRRKHKVSMDLFRRIASETDQPRAYSEDQSSMLAMILIAALERKS